jgi:Na+/H+ antiporter NhaD/arsenite permease-like protein
LDASVAATWIIFALTYAGLAIGKVPGLRMDRAGIALVGATLMLVTGALTLRQAVGEDSIDYKTLSVLFGMMVVIAFLRLSGFFLELSAWALKRMKSPVGLLAVTIGLSGVLSAFLINDIVCLTLTPLVLHLARRMKIDPVPHLIALATAANIGSTGTITGNPQNIFIGSHSGISYLRFAARLLPVAAIGLLLNFAVVALIYRKRLSRSREDQPSCANGGNGETNSRRPLRAPHLWLLRKSIVVTLVTLVLFFTGLPLELIALGAAAVLLLGRVKPEKVYRQIDWGLLVMFTGLFIVVHAFQVHVVSKWGIDHWGIDHWGIDHWGGLTSHPVGSLSVISAALSNLVSNVPAVLLMEPIVNAVPTAGRETAWLALAMSSTLAGNLTVLGSVANLIVVENARRQGVEISFWEYCKVGIPLTILTLGVGIVWLAFVRY